MKKSKKLFSILTSFMIIGAFSVIKASAKELSLSDKYFGGISMPEDSILINDNNCGMILCSLDSENYMEVRKIDFYYGIILELENESDFDALELKYDFKPGSIVPAVIDSNSYIYDIGDDISEEQIKELSEYAAELRKKDGVKRAELFRNVCGMNGCIDGAAKTGAMILLDNGDEALDIEMLNSDAKLKEYLKSIGADAEIKTDHEYISKYNGKCNIKTHNKKAFAVTGIDDRKQLLDICEHLNEFDVINGRAYIPYTWQPSFIVFETNYLNYNSEITLLSGDANGDGVLDVRDAAHIARKLAQRKAHELPPEADFNGDGKIDVRDAANIAKKLAEAKAAPQKEAITTSVKETDTSVTINPSYTTVTVPIELITSDVSKSTETVPTQGETADIKWVVNDDKQLIISKNNTGNTCSTGDWCETYIEYGTVYTLDGGSFEIPIEKDRILETPWSKCDYNSVIIEEGVTEIGDCTFYSAKFDKITLPDSLKVIKTAAFREVKSSAKFILPPNLTDIGAAAFMYSSFDFGDVVFSSSLSNLGKFAFSGCSGINSVDLSRSSVKDIKDYTFENCRNLQSVNFPLQLESIGDDAFANTNIKEYVILSRNVMFDYHPMGYYSQTGEPVATETKFIGYAGSTVEEYANSSDKFSFEPLDEE